MLAFFCRNGPGQLEIFGARIDQPFDGDGMICRLTFADGKAHFSNRYLLCTHGRDTPGVQNPVHSMQKCTNPVY